METLPLQSIKVVRNLYVVTKMPGVVEVKVGAVAEEAALEAAVAVAMMVAGPELRSMFK